MTKNPDDRAAAAAAELRALIREAHEAAQALAEQRREFEQVIVSSTAVIRDLALTEVGPKMEAFKDDTLTKMDRWVWLLSNYLTQAITHQLKAWDDSITARWSHLGVEPALLASLEQGVRTILAGGIPHGMQPADTRPTRIRLDMTTFPGPDGTPPAAAPS